VRLVGEFVAFDMVNLDGSAAFAGVLNLKLLRDRDARAVECFENRLDLVTPRDLAAERHVHELLGKALRMLNELVARILPGLVPGQKTHRILVIVPCLGA